MTSLALFDIDGVLADDTERLPFALDRQWSEYFKPERVWADRPLTTGFMRLEAAFYVYDDVMFMTGRRGDLRWVTLAWLNFHLASLTTHGPQHPEDLIMRPFPDSTAPRDRPRLAEFKEQEIRKLQTHYDQITLWDDDPEVVSHVQEHFGDSAAEHCTWYTKNPALVKRASS